MDRKTPTSIRTPIGGSEMMMTIRNTDCDDEMYQLIKDCLNDISINKQIKKSVDSFRKDFQKDLKVKCSRSYIMYVCFKTITTNKKRWKKFKNDFIKKMKESS